MRDKLRVVWQQLRCSDSPAAEVLNSQGSDNEYAKLCSCMLSLAIETAKENVLKLRT